jgi:hypothetical protein
MAAALASLSGFYGDAWQPSTRKPSRNADGYVLQRGTLIVPVPGKRRTARDREQSARTGAAAESTITSALWRPALNSGSASTPRGERRP